MQYVASVCLCDFLLSTHHNKNCMQYHHLNMLYLYGVEPSGVTAILTNNGHSAKRLTTSWMPVLTDLMI